MEEISTAGLAPADRLPFWNEVARTMVAPVRVTPLGSDGFTARLRRWRLRDCELVVPSSSPARIAGGEEGTPATFNLQVQHAGRSTATVAGRTCELAEGDFMLFDSTQPTRLEFAEPTLALVLRLPLACVERHAPQLKAVVGRRVRGDAGPGALFSTLIRKWWTQLEAGETGAGAALDEVMWPLLGLAYAGDRADVPDPRPRDERRRALLTLVEQHLCDPALDVHRIAQRMGVSPRYVQMLFAEIGTTPTAYIQRQRLDLAGHRFEREGARCSVTTVAFDVGFNDLSSFCRAFRRRFAVAPREYRAGLRGRPALSS